MNHQVSQQMPSYFCSLCLCFFFFLCLFFSFLCFFRELCPSSAKRRLAGLPRPSVEPLTPEREDKVVPSWRPKSRVGLLAGGGEMSAESSSKMSDGRDLDISVMLAAPLWEGWRRLQSSILQQARKAMSRSVSICSDLVKECHYPMCGAQVP